MTPHPSGDAPDAARMILDGVSEVIFVCTPEGVIRDVNVAACEQSGFSRDALIGHAVHEFLVPEDLVAHPLDIPRVMAGERVDNLHRIRRSDGSERVFETSAVRLSDGNVGVTARDVTERQAATHALQRAHKRLARQAEELRDREKDLRLLTHAADASRESERQSISQQIHDELGQVLSAIKLDLHWIEGHIGDLPEIRERLEALIDLSDRSIGAVKRICSVLRPALLDDEGLEAALEWHLQEVEKHTPLHCDLHIQLTHMIPVGLQRMLFRIVQEALSNVARHAQARRVGVHLSTTDACIALVVEDDGCGIDMERARDRRGLGLLAMRERVYDASGSMDIIGVKGCGTTLRILIPLPQLGRTGTDAG